MGTWYQAVVLAWTKWLHLEHRAAPVKSEQRAAEKILRSYEGKPERVLDFVRSTILVDNIAQVKEVLTFVCAEANVHIIKNRFDPSFDAKETFGYRDVNLQLSFPEFQGTPFEGFVLELQIH